MRDDQTRLRHSQVTVGGSSLHVVQAGDPEGAPFVFLHGWPQSWRCWSQVMPMAAQHVRAVALDLPGIGGSTGHPTDGSKRELASAVRGLIENMGLKDVTLVGQDVGGMIVYSYLRAFQDLRRAVIMDVVVPGIAPWEQVLKNPYIWHFAFHTIPSLPERLVQGRQGKYFDYFFDVLSHDPAKITAEARSAYVEAYATDRALTAGFNWYRTFPQDAASNSKANDESTVSTPVLYLRGEGEGGRMADYLDGFRAAGLIDVLPALIPGAGHFTQDEAPEQTWRLIADFAGL